MAATTQPGQTTWTLRRVIAELPFISAASNWLKLLLSLLAEPLMFVSSLFIVAETVIPGSASWSPFLMNGTNTVMSLAPEIILPGCFQQAQHAMAHGNKVKSWLLYGLCTLFGLLTLVTLASFVWHFTAIVGAALLFVRCGSGLSYTIILNISGPVAEIAPAEEAPDATQDVLESMQAAIDAATQHMQQIEATNQQMAQQNNALAQQMALLSQQNRDLTDQTQGALTDLSCTVNQIKEDLATPPATPQQSQQKIFALPARPANDTFAGQQSDDKDTGETFAVDRDIVDAVQSLMALEALADIEQSDIYKVVEAYQGGIGKSQIYQHLGWGSAKHTKIVKPIIDAWLAFSKDQQRSANA